MAKFLGVNPRCLMPDPKSTSPSVERRLLPAPKWSAARRQQKFMVVSLALLLGALVSILYRDRDFWFPDTEQAADAPLQQNAVEKPVVSSATSVGPSSTAVASRINKPRSQQPSHAKSPEISAEVQAPQPVVVSARTVLPPLEVEVVAGDAHRVARPGSNSVKVDMQQSRPPVRATAQPPIEVHSDPPIVPTNAADRARVSPASATVIESVRPDYPMLARQMKVQGSVILQALIGRDGLIQDLHVLSGPPILSAAAQEAVRQWHFKPHYLGSQAVETETKITVNFTISTY